MRIPAITGALVGAFAANDAIVSKYAKRRLASPGRLPAGFEVPGFADMTRLLHPSRDAAGGDEQRVARISAAAAFQALEATRDEGDDPYVPKSGGYAEQLLSDTEHKRLQEHARAHAKEKKTLRKLCRYCLLFQDLVHQEGDPPIEVLSHSARIFSDFDPRTNISEASINDFQLFVPRDLAFQALERSHPLLWRDSAPDLFTKTCAARRRNPNKPHIDWKPVDVDIDSWEEAAFHDRKEYLYERAKFPWNEYLTATLENVFEIRNFGDLLVPAATLNTSVTASVRNTNGVSGGVQSLLGGRKARAAGHRLMLAKSTTQPSCNNDQARILSYGYALETCLRSSYGLGWEERGGLDIDDGRFDGSAVHFEQVKPAYVRHLTRSDLTHLTHVLTRRPKRKHLKALMPHVNAIRDIVERLPNDEGNEKAKHEATMHVARALQAIWGEDPWLVTISATKRLRYTFPRNGPTELWTILSWAAPALLFTFMNRSVCQLPNFLKPAKTKKAK